MPCDRCKELESRLVSEIQRGHDLQAEVAALQSPEHCASAHDHTDRCGWCQRDEAIRVLCAVEGSLGGNYRELVETFLAPYVKEPVVQTCQPDSNPELTAERLHAFAEAGESAKAYVAAVVRGTTICDSGYHGDSDPNKPLTCPYCNEP